MSTENKKRISESNDYTELVEGLVGDSHQILDDVDEINTNQEIDTLLQELRDKLNMMTPDSRPYFSPREEAARIELIERLQLTTDYSAQYTEELTIGQAIKHLDHRTVTGLKLVRESMKLH